MRSTGRRHDGQGESEFGWTCAGTLSPSSMWAGLFNRRASSRELLTSRIGIE